jgi:hypothetical protein
MITHFCGECNKLILYDDHPNRIMLTNNRSKLGKREIFCFWCPILGIEISSELDEGCKFFEAWQDKVYWTKNQNPQKW